MDQRSRDIDSIFAGAIELKDPKQQTAFLDKACGGDEQMRRRLEKLVAAHPEATGSFLQSPPSGLAETEASVNVQLGEQMGPYKLLQKLGEGGFGVVYLAEQKQPVQRRVALKIIKPGMDTGQVIARFEAERQALAMMDHPGIAKVFDAGATPTGRPFFVMELVKGVPITQYCDEQHFTPIQRLEMFVQVCQAVQHAHQKGIIHRDLKPQNILVAEYDQRPVAKVIDFGIAKATNQKLTEKTIFTQFGQIIGTLEYMSPEQAELTQLDIDTRSDVYSLGVILYELLTGVTPFEREKLRSAGYQEMLRIIREEDPPKPSTRISGWGKMTQKLSGSRRISVQKMRNLVHGDLDWIVMKSLEKDRARRYESASAFADDIQRYLTDEPVVARPPSATYRFSKFARRNRSALAIAATLFLVLAVGGAVVGTALGQVQAQKQRALAKSESEKEALNAVGGLVNAKPNRVRDILDALPGTPETTEHLQRALAAFVQDADDELALKMSLALVENDQSRVDYLLRMLTSEKSSLLDANPEYISLICRALESRATEIENGLWEALHGEMDDGKSDGRRFRAGIALASLVPKSDLWKDSDYQFLAEHLVSKEFDSQAALRDFLRPLIGAANASQVFLRHFEQLIEEGPETARVKTALACVDFARNDDDRMARLLAVAIPGEVFDTLFASIQNSPSVLLVERLEEVAATLPPENLSSTDRIDWGQKRANAGITLLRLRKYDAALTAFHHTDDPEATTQFIHGCKVRGVRPDDVLQLVDLFEQQVPSDDSLRYALILLLGEYEWTDLPDPKRQSLLAHLNGQYQNHPSSAVHSATSWLLRDWNQGDAVTRVDRTPVAYSPDREWFNVKVQANSNQELFLTFVVFQPSEFEIGSVLDEPLRGDNEPRHSVKITRPFALLDREISFQELLACNPKHEKIMGMYTAKPDTAGPGTMWYDSVQFCRWLTTQFGGLEKHQVYEPLDYKSESGTVDLTDRSWPIHVDRQGFRLPTEAEWEYACRSGMRTAFSFGGDEDLLQHYAWFAENSSKKVHQAKQMRPHPRGLFDIHGNLFEWCHDWIGPFPQDGLTIDYLGPNAGPGRVLRGGCWGVLPAFCRSSNRISMPPETNFIFEGIRICVTLPSGRAADQSDASLGQ